MPCQTCTSPSDLAVCLFCGHQFCDMHRGERDGAIACSECLKEAHRAESKRPAARVQAVKASQDLSGEVRVAPPPPLLPEPGWGAKFTIPAATISAAIAGSYLYWLLNWLLTRHMLPDWLPSAGATAGGLFVLVSVWIICKSKFS